MTLSQATYVGVDNEVIPYEEFNIGGNVVALP